MHGVPGSLKIHLTGLPQLCSGAGCELRGRKIVTWGTNLETL